MEAIAKTKYLKGSPRKARLVIDLIRGQDVSRALAILKFTEKRAAAPIEKTLRSAIANATYQAEQMNIAVDPDDLWVKSCFVDMGPTKHRRRMRPAPQGRAYREQRHYCHITIEVTSEEKPKTEKELKAEEVKAKRAAAPKKTKKKSEPTKEVKKAKADTVEEAPEKLAEESIAVEAVEDTKVAGEAGEEVVAEPENLVSEEISSIGESVSGEVASEGTREEEKEK
ncbi:50S ribosomal protein L22 [Leptolyngbya sp. 7M]|uniref:50S ribosomal protein L22 n=1 Tax=Leptolyngbya sp. 7M TaxID=2812896 RepID=UPI001B8D03F7|nr:50S ribosomal protein L22 [Leptolyngbya sp. 7M]